MGVSPPNAITPRKVKQHYHIAQARSWGQALSPPSMPYVLFILRYNKGNSTGPIKKGFT